MLHEFLSSNREQLIRRCRAKVRKRAAPPVTELELEALVEALRCEQEKPPRRGTATSSENSRAAALHGKELLEEGWRTRKGLPSRSTSSARSTVCSTTRFPMSCPRSGDIATRQPRGRPARALLESSLGKLRELIDGSLPPGSAPPKP
jgi:hypothetical protein